jgi:predicted TIM-barrel fold metal-dependent hydrolase
MYLVSIQNLMQTLKVELHVVPSDNSPWQITKSAIRRDFLTGHMYLGSLDKTGIDGSIHIDIADSSRQLDDQRRLVVREDR